MHRVSSVSLKINVNWTLTLRMIDTQFKLDVSRDKISSETKLKVMPKSNMAKVYSTKHWYWNNSLKKDWGTGLKQTAWHCMFWRQRISYRWQSLLHSIAEQRILHSAGITCKITFLCFLFNSIFTSIGICECRWDLYVYTRKS